MKKAILLLCMAAGLMSCAKGLLNPQEESARNEGVPMTFDVTVLETKAAKTGWADGDKIYVFFNGLETKYLVMTYSIGTGWSDASGGGDLLDTDFSGLGTKKLSAVHFPVAVDVTYSDSKFSFTSGDKPVYNYYLFEEGKDYTVDGTTVSATLSMGKPADMVQIHVAGIESSVAAYTFCCSKIKPVACTSVGVDGSVTESVLQAGARLSGIADSDGGIFAGRLTSPDVPADYEFTVTDGTEIYTLTRTGKTLTAGTMYNFPALSVTGGANWTVTAASNLRGGLDIREGYDPDKGFPIQVTANASTASAKAKYYTVRWRNLDDPDDTGEERVTIQDPAQEYTATYYWKPGWLTDDALIENIRYSFDVILENDNEKVLLNDPQSMDFVKIHYDPNPGPWTAANKPQVSWPPQKVTDLDFSAGDFLDSYMDVSNCYYQMRGSSPNSTNDLGMDNLFTIGSKNNLEWNSGTMFLYYPAHDNLTGIDRLQVSTRGSETNRVQPCELSADILWFCLKRDLTEDRGVFRMSNGDGFDQEPDWTKDIRGNGNVTGASTLERLDFLTGQSTLYIGSTESQHRSRAKYLYIRVVRKHDFTS